jgi:phosphoglycerate dehydrogenase-like enzyme
MKINKVLITSGVMIDYIKKKNIKKKYPNIKSTLFDTKQSPNKKKLLSVIKPYDSLIYADDKIYKRVINDAKNLKVISKWGTSIDLIDNDYHKTKNYLTKIKNCILSSHNVLNCKEEVDLVNKNTLNNLILNLK